MDDHMNKNRYVPTALSMYLNYVVHGMGVIMLSQNQNALMAQWNTDLIGVSSVISMLGIGRLIAIVFSGPLSDKFGRKPFIYLGMVTYLLFFMGIVFSPSVGVAMAFAVIAGLANSFLDSGTYPALMESFPKNAGTANVLIKAAVQIGQFILPFVIALIIASQAWFGWSFIIAAILLVINMLVLWRMPFPDTDAREATAEGEEKTEIAAVKFKKKPKMWFEGVAFVLYGFISQSTFYLVSQYLNTYAQAVADMPANTANQLISYYSIGSMTCVAITAVLATKIRSVNLVLVYTAGAFASIAAMYLWPTPTVLTFGAGLVGFFAAGGVMQLGLTVMGEMFPAGKGTITSIFYTFGSIASYVIPVVTSRIAAINPRNIMLFDTIIAGIGFVIGIFVFIRYHQVVDLSPEKDKGEPAI